MRSVYIGNIYKSIYKVKRKAVGLYIGKAYSSTIYRIGSNAVGLEAI